MKIRKIIIYLFILLLINLSLSLSKVQAFSLSEIKGAAEGFLSASDDDEVLATIDTGKLRDTNSTIYNVLLGIGIIVAVIIGAFLGIQFIFGSVEGKAKISEALVPYIIGCAVVFGAFTVWKLAVNVGNKVGDRSLPTSTVRRQTSNTNQRINNGEIGSFTDAEVIDAYRRNNIDGNLNEKVNGARNPNKVSLSTAVSQLTGEQKIIYNEMKKRGLLADNGIWAK